MTQTSKEKAIRHYFNDFPITFTIKDIEEHIASLKKSKDFGAEDALRFYEALDIAIQSEQKKSKKEKEEIFNEIEDILYSDTSFIDLEELKQRLL